MNVTNDYFTNYCNSGESYDQTYLAYSGIEHCIDIIDRFKIRVISVAVLGTATGRVLEHFDRAWGIRPSGCEINEWAHSRIPTRYRRRVDRCDQVDYVQRMARAGRRVDLIFGGALVYLNETQIEELLRQCSGICSYYHFLSSTSEAYEPGDKFRATLRSRKWWRQRFIDAGFRQTRSPYLFASSKKPSY